MSLFSNYILLYGCYFVSNCIADLLYTTTQPFFFYSRYKTIQELGKKMAAKDKGIQEMRKRMEQAQLIAIPGTSVAERRNSISNSEPKNITWETPSRLATVNE